jgi:hypothetical protein
VCDLELVAGWTEMVGLPDVDGEIFSAVCCGSLLVESFSVMG